MGFENLDMVKYYTDAYNDSHKAAMDAIAEPNPDVNKVKMLIRRARQDKMAMDLNIALRKNNEKK
jgi:hypothetical protein